MRFWLKAIGGLVVAFVLQGVFRSGFYAAFGRRLLQSGGWTPGSVPPTSYMTTSVVVAVLAATIGGIGAALVVGRARIRHALAYSALFAGLAIWGNRSTLFGNPHPYEWPLILAPILAMPLGAWLVVYLKPLSKDGSLPAAAA